MSRAALRTLVARAPPPTIAPSRVASRRNVSVATRARAPPVADDDDDDHDAGSDDAPTTTSSGPSSTSPAGRPRPSIVVLDGANLAWTYSASLYAKHGCRTRLPLSRGVALALECDAWASMRLTPHAFIPRSYVEGPLHGLCDGGSLETLVPGNVEYLWNATWRNTVLHDFARRGMLTTVTRAPNARDADDKRIIAFALGASHTLVPILPRRRGERRSLRTSPSASLRPPLAFNPRLRRLSTPLLTPLNSTPTFARMERPSERDAVVCSNDRYEDHVVSAGSAEKRKELRRWLSERRSGYEFQVGSVLDAAYANGGGDPTASPPPVGWTHLPSPPLEERGDGDGDGGDGGDGDAGSRAAWREDVHATGSSRPWAIGESRWGRDATRGGRRGRGKRRRRGGLGDAGGGGKAKRAKGKGDGDGDEFPYWALPARDLPVVFKVKKNVAAN